MRESVNKTQGAFYTGEYTNVLKKFGYSEDVIDKRVEEVWQQIFYGDENTKIYYPIGEDEGYLLDTGNNDVRTEGMSYGMMMSVQLNKKEEFDRIWTWTKRYMWQNEGEYEGYFAWSVDPSGRKNSQGPAPDGEEYFAMALFFAWRRWGDGEEPYNYSEQAKQILHECIHKGRNGGLGNPMWDPSNKLIKFIPECNFTDPSYHLPHFYELFALWANEEDSAFWAEAANASREYLKKACHPVTGLAPEYANYDGTPNTERSDFQYFFSDSFRVAGNIALDYEWFRKDEQWQSQQSNRIQAFFAPKGFDKVYYKCTIEGEDLEQKVYHPYGLIAMNAMASLAAKGEYARLFVDEFWNLPVCTGVRRYYDNCLYMFSILALSGKYRIW